MSLWSIFDHWHSHNRFSAEKPASKLTDSYLYVRALYTTDGLGPLILIKKGENLYYSMGQIACVTALAQAIQLILCAFERTPLTAVKDREEASDECCYCLFGSLFLLFKSRCRFRLLRRVGARVREGLLAGMSLFPHFWTLWSRTKVHDPWYLVPSALVG